MIKNRILRSLVIVLVAAAAFCDVAAYKAELHVTDANGKEIGGMDVDMRFSAAYKLTSFLTGSTSPELDLAKSHGSAFWDNKSADITSLVK